MAWRTVLWSKWKDVWAEQFPICIHGNNLGGWLFADRDPETKDVIGIGCKVCRLAGLRSSAARCQWTTSNTMLSKHFHRHAASQIHLEALASMGHCAECTAASKEATDNKAAPSIAEFAGVWDARRQGMVQGVAAQGSKKRSMMEFCLAEAMRMHDRMHIRKCQSLVTHVDTKGTKFTMRISATSKELITKKFSLGHVDKKQHTVDRTESYVDAVKQILRNFCTHFHFAPCRHIVFTIKFM